MGDPGADVLSGTRDLGDVSVVVDVDDLVEVERVEAAAGPRAEAAPREAVAAAGPRARGRVGRGRPVLEDGEVRDHGGVARVGRGGRGVFEAR